MNVRKIAIAAAMLLIAISMDAARKPLIGISAGGSRTKESVNTTYVEAVRRAGGIPVIIPKLSNPDQAKEAISRLDGIIFTGGEDFDPDYYGEKALPGLGEVNSYRDTSDIALAREAVAKNLPILGICRGEQLLNIVMGGSLFQDIPSQKPSEIQHRQSESSAIPTHPIIVEKESLLHDLMGADTLMVNSFHHEGVKALGNGLRITAVAPDGIVEAYQSNSKKPRLLAVQFHPEGLSRADDRWLAIFRWLVNLSK